MQAEEVEDVGEGVEGGRGRLLVLQGVEVVDVVTAHDQQQRPREQLQGVCGAVEVPHRRRCANSHGEMEPPSVLGASPAIGGRR